MNNLYRRAPENTVHGIWAINTQKKYLQKLIIMTCFTLFSNSEMLFSWLFIQKDRKNASRIIRAFWMGEKKKKFDLHCIYNQ